MTDLVMGERTLPANLEKTTKVGRLPWIGRLNQALGEGLANSQWLADVQADQIGAGRQISRDLWPFIVKLPDNIKSVREKLPPALDSAKLFLSNLADDERNFQAQYIKQCQLAGLTMQDLMTSEAQPIKATAALVESMRSACMDRDVVCGVQAIVASELAATQFARSVKDAFEVYFDIHACQYDPERVAEGLAWVRLHAKPNTRHAIWMNRMLVGLESEASGEAGPALPPTARQILEAIFALWRVNESTTRTWL